MFVEESTPDTPSDCHICRSVGVVWGVNVRIYGIYGVFGTALWKIFVSFLRSELVRSQQRPFICTWNNLPGESDE